MMVPAAAATVESPNLAISAHDQPLFTTSFMQ
jgi:hypothetical protein